MRFCMVGVLLQDSERSSDSSTIPHRWLLPLKCFHMVGLSLHASGSCDLVSGAPRLSTSRALLSGDVNDLGSHLAQRVKDALATGVASARLPAFSCIVFLASSARRTRQGSMQPHSERTDRLHRSRGRCEEATLGSHGSACCCYGASRARVRGARPRAELRPSGAQRCAERPQPGLGSPRPVTSGSSPDFRPTNFSRRRSEGCHVRHVALRRVRSLRRRPPIPPGGPYALHPTPSRLPPPPPEHLLTSSSALSCSVAVPLALSHPPAELAYVLQDAGVSVILAQEEFAAVLRPLLKAGGCDASLIDLAPAAPGKARPRLP